METQNEPMDILRNMIGYTKKGREHMHPEQQGNVVKKRGRTVLQIAAAGILAAALALLAYFVWQLHRETVSLRDALESNAMSYESIQCSIERMDRPVLTFSIARFDLNYKKDDYGEGYSGTAFITCDLPVACIVILKTTLVSGGSAYTEDVSYSLVIVHDGIGRYSTYDWAETGKIEKPVYAFEVVGYFQAEKNGE